MKNLKLDCKTVLALALASLASVSGAMECAELTGPVEVLLDGRPAGSRIAVKEDGRVLLAGGTASWVKMSWNVDLGAETRVLGGMWERTYGDSSWMRVDAPDKPRDGNLAWYFLAQIRRGQALAATCEIRASAGLRVGWAVSGRF